MTALTFEGVVESWAEPDAAASALTTRVGGTDVLEVVAEAAAELHGPIAAAVTIGTEPPLIGLLRINLGYSGRECGDGTCFEPAEFTIDGTSVIHLLDQHDKQPAQVNVTLTGVQIEPERVVPVEWAHHCEYDDRRFKPLDVIELPVSEAQRLTRAGMITRDSAAAAGLAVPA